MCDPPDRGVRKLLLLVRLKVVTLYNAVLRKNNRFADCCSLCGKRRQVVEQSSFRASSDAIIMPSKQVHVGPLANCMQGIRPGQHAKSA